MKFQIIFILLFLIGGVSAVSYMSSNPQYTQSAFNSQSYLSQQGINLYRFDDSSCSTGSDFIVQITPFGCTPSVVRSDLLEEQNVPVFCQLAATKINPLIDVEAIKSMSIGFNGPKPDAVTGVGFHPARAALKGGSSSLLNSPLLNNIGYAVIVLKQNPVESSMPDWVRGNLTATIRYDVQNTFGVGESVFYVPQTTDEDWTYRWSHNSFWKAKGFLRANQVGSDYVSLSVYLDKNNELVKTTLSSNQTSGKFYLPGFYCRAGFQLKFEGLEAQKTTALIRVDGDLMQLTEGEKFLENRCILRKISDSGLADKISIECKTDNEVLRKDLSISPRVNLKVGDDGKDYSLNEIVHSAEGDNYIVAYIGTGRKIGNRAVLDTNSEQDLFVILKKTKSSSLSDQDLLSVSRSAHSVLINGGISVGQGLYLIKNDGEGLSLTSRGGNLAIKINSFSSALNVEVDEPGFRENFDSALSDYRTIIELYPNEQVDPHESFGIQAYKQAIGLTENVGQRIQTEILCKEFLEKYPEFKSDTSLVCNQKYKLSNSDLNTIGVYVNGFLKQISFEGVSVPSLEDYSLELNLRTADGGIQTYTLGKDQVIFLNDNEYISLVELNDNSAKLKIFVKNSANNAGNIDKTVDLRLGAIEAFDSNYRFSISRINLNKAAKVRIVPSIDNQQSKADFTFNVAIEKRAIQLAPNEIEKKISDLNKTINKWEEISENLGTVVTGFKAACLTTGAALVVKNFFQNWGGQALARQEVMRGEGGWITRCQQSHSRGEYYSVDACLLDNSQKIDADVEAYNRIIGKSGEVTEANFKVRAGELEGDGNLCPGANGEYQTLCNEYLNDGGLKEGVVSEAQLRDLIRYNEIANDNTVSSELKESAKLKRDTLATSLERRARGVQAIQQAREEYNAGEVVPFSSGNIKTVYISQRNLASDYVSNELNKGDIGKRATVVIDQSIAKQYLLILTPASDGSFTVSKTYEKNGNGWDVMNSPNPLGVRVEELDANAYKNPFESTPEVKYFDSEPYKGLPAVVPFDLKNGWYVYTRQTVSFSSSTRAYDDSGQVNSFYLCNIGANRRIDYDSSVGDDICRNFNPARNEAYGEFPGLSKQETDSLVRRATNAINEAARKYRSGGGSIDIAGQSMKIGTAANYPDIQCQDYMSPSDCHILFNVCDPVICPSSRCDLGGTYRVDDVIQSGIVGSLALCLPNIREEIYVPICLTGVKAGVDGLLSVYKNYRDCLQTNLDSGQTVGICDQVHSIYLCEFFWRQSLPLSRLIIPKMIEAALGTGGRGGGEYGNVASAWANAEGSVNYFTNYYGANSYNAFKMRTTDEVGSAVCKSFVSARYPASGEFFSALIKPDSPPQYHATFEEIPFTSATVPPTSQYKIFYHIYAGQDIGGSYQVYLKSPTGGSFYASNPRVVVGSGFIPVGQYASQTVDLTLPSGYRELCVSVNAKEECGFKQVSTSFALNYMKDEILKQQVVQTNIKTESECLSGTVGIPSSIGLNLQEDLDNALNPEIYDQGIVRVCSTDNPGRGIDLAYDTPSSTWVEVGTCDNQGRLKCWLDTRSLTGSFNMEANRDAALQDIINRRVSQLQAEGDYFTNDKFEELITGNQGKLNTNPQEVVSAINEDVLKKIFLGVQKARALLLRGDAYSKLAEAAYNKYIDSLTFSSSTTTATDTASETPIKNSIGLFMENYENYLGGGNPSASFNHDLVQLTLESESNDIYKINLVYSDAPPYSSKIFFNPLRPDALYLIESPSTNHFFNLPPDDVPPSELTKLDALRSNGIVSNGDYLLLKYILENNYKIDSDELIITKSS